MYTIGQVADIVGISKDKLRYYKEKGLLKPNQKAENNYRQYNENDIDKLLVIELYRSIDLSIKDIKCILDICPGYN